jgi:hypothetical protein
MSLRYNNVQTSTVSETHGHCFILPITFYTSSRLYVSLELLPAQLPPTRASEQQWEVTSNNNKVENTLYICKKKLLGPLAVPFTMYLDAIIPI